MGTCGHSPRLLGREALGQELLLPRQELLLLLRHHLGEG